MSLVSASRRHLAQWATRASVRPMAIIPEFPQVKEIRDAQRVDFFGDQQDIDSRYALLDKVRQKAIAHEERFRTNGKGFVRPWEVKPELEGVIDEVVHVADDEKKNSSF